MPALQLPLEIRQRIGLAVGAMLLAVHVVQPLGRRINLDGIVTGRLCPVEWFCVGGHRWPCKVRSSQEYELELGFGGEKKEKKKKKENGIEQGVLRTGRCERESRKTGAFHWETPLNVVKNDIPTWVLSLWSLHGEERSFPFSFLSLSPLVCVLRLSPVEFPEIETRRDAIDKKDRDKEAGMTNENTKDNSPKYREADDLR